MELYAIRYGEHFAYAKYENIYKGMGRYGEVSEFIFSRYLARYNGKIILIDTGFRDKATAEKMGITLIDVEDEVKDIINGIDCIDTIFITHSHFDHIENLDLYKESSVIISKPEYDIALKKSPDSIKARLEAGNIITVDDEYVYDDLFKFKVIGGHTPGSSVLYFDEGQNKYVIIGDECYMCDNVYMNTPNGNCVDCQKNEKFIFDTYNKGLIPLPFHDAKIFEKYAQVSENIVRIVQGVAEDSLLNAEDFNVDTEYYKAIDTWKYLQTYNIMSSFIYNFYICFRNGNIIMSPKDISLKLPFYYEESIKYSGMGYEEWYSEFLE